MKKTVALCSAFLLMVSAMSGCSTSNNKPAEQQPSAPATAYDEEKTADVIVVGAGGAGLSAAIAATDNGAQNVIIIEKTNRTGGNLNLTSGSMSAAETSLQKEAGIEDTHLRAMVAYRLALIYEQLGDADRRKEYLIRATADDLRTPVREGMALYTLAGLLLEEGDVERANRYINCSMEDALYCNYRSRMQQSSEMVQQIAGAYIDSLDAKRRAMGYVTIVVSLLVVVLLGSFFTILVYYRKIRQISAARLEMNRQLRELNEHIRSINGELRDANNIKDEYVGHYLSLCSRYIVRINDYRKLLLKVYKDGDCDALIRELRTKNPADAEYKEFLAIFDETFLHLFPDFVAHVNRLMTDAERFSPRQPRTLNTELRILALIRLGVTHSAKIAAILNCSVATIHTYRAQLRNAAIGDRNAFDDAIRRIDIAGAEPSQTA